jgi:transcriptional regulator of NAD metabolism
MENKQKKILGENRRERVISDINNSPSPISARELAGIYGVSRQLIVQDIALLRAQGHNILSTNEGYITDHQGTAVRVFCVIHDDDNIKDELNTVVDLGGKVLDVFIEHKAYGHMGIELNISSRRDVDKLIEQLSTGKSEPLNHLTNGRHCHTVEAENEDILNLIESKLRDQGYLYNS